MEQSERFKNQNAFLIILIVVFCFVYAGKDSNYWDLIPKSREELLIVVGAGFIIAIIAKMAAKLKNRSVLLITLGAIICIVYIGKSSHYWGLLPKTADEILYEVGMGLTSPSEIKLNSKQFDDIKSAIDKNPDNYNSAQKSLIVEKSGKDILIEVGMGITNPKDLKLTSNQLKEIKNLIDTNPEQYNNVQQSLINLTPKE